MYVSKHISLKINADLDIISYAGKYQVKQNVLAGRYARKFDNMEKLSLLRKADNLAYLN